jgi:uncharacterized membrane protein YedE/YeeE
MKPRMIGLLFGTAFGFVISWAQLTHPDVIRKMLLLREPDVFLLMGSGILVAAIGVRLLRGAGARAIVTREVIDWSSERPRARHVVGSVLFGAGWSVAATCPGPVAAMIGEGHVGGAVVAAGIFIGVVLQAAVEKKAAELSAVPGL